MSKLFDILAVDDEHVIIDSIKKLNRLTGWQVDTATDASIALKKLNKNRYRLIICDIMMPDVDGFQFLEKLHEKGIYTPLVMTTGYSTVENAVKSLSGGAIDFLPKPFTFDELLSVASRGLQYEALLQNRDEDNGSTLVYVPCPDDYQRLGYASWSVITDDGTVKIGLTDLFFKTIEELEKIELFDQDDDIIQGNACAYIHTTDEISHSVLAPVSGRIINRNDTLLQDKTLLEKDPYFEGWLYTVVPSDLEYEYKHLAPCNQ